MMTKVSVQCPESPVAFRGFLETEATVEIEYQERKLRSECDYKL